MLPSLLTVLTSLASLSSPGDSTARLAAASELEAAIEHAASSKGRSSRALSAAIDAARRVLGPQSEMASELGELEHGARFKALFDEDEAASWLIAQLDRVVSDLRFEPVLEADLPAGFPATTLVGEIRIQRYPAYRAARTGTEGARGQGAFWRLFEHIEENDIAMTAPVETTFRAEGERQAAASMAFLYASSDLGRAGARGAVEVVDFPALSAASIGMRGPRTPQRVEAARVKLERWIDERPGWKRSGPLRTLEYNGPAVREERRFFEVQIPVSPTSEIAVDFSDADEVSRWRSVDDVVMGGRSSSRLIPEPDGTASFAGELSLENNGGFASVRTSGERISLTGAESVVLRALGDGKAYRLRFFVATSLGEIGYQATFPTTAGRWIDVELRLDDFEPRWRGRLITNAPPLDPSAVRGVGLTIGDRQEGPFRLELRSLRKVPASGPE